MKVVPELYCKDLAENIAFFVDALGFTIKYTRPEEGFVYLTRDGVDLMLEDLSIDTRKWLTGDLDYPFGRGINFQWDVHNLAGMYASVQANCPKAIYLPWETKVYLVAGQNVSQSQFIVQSPDGYLFRFCEEAEAPSNAKDECELS